ncbi:MAG: hypothetical protein ACREEM_40105 [Blastocatellia bacterium]
MIIFRHVPSLILFAYLIGFAPIQPSPINRQNKPPDKRQPDKPKPAQTPPVKKETTVQWLLRFLGISATPSAMKGEDDALAGDLWLYDSTTQTGQRITREGGYRSPVVLTRDANLLALKGEQVVEIAIESRAVKPRHTIPGIVKLIAVDAADANRVLFLRASEGQRFSAGALSLNDGRIEARELDLNSEDDRRMLAHLRGWERSYDGGKTVVYTKTETKEGLAGAVEWRDVYLKREGRDTVNVSNCDGANCGQPSLSPGGRYVTYVKAP